MSRIHVVIRSTGQYTDLIEEPVRAYTNEDDARHHVELASAIAEEASVIWADLRKKRPHGGWNMPSHGQRVPENEWRPAYDEDQRTLANFIASKGGAGLGISGDGDGDESFEYKTVELIGGTK